MTALNTRPTAATLRQLAARAERLTADIQAAATALAADPDLPTDHVDGLPQAAELVHLAAQDVLAAAAALPRRRPRPHAEPAPQTAAAAPSTVSAVNGGEIESSPPAANSPERAELLLGAAVAPRTAAAVTSDAAANGDHTGGLTPPAQSPAVLPGATSPVPGQTVAHATVVKPGAWWRRAGRVLRACFDLLAYPLGRIAGRIHAAAVTS